MPGEDPEDRGASGPPHPHDRAWFHPSELQGFVSASSADRATGPRRRGLTAAVVAGSIALAALIGVGGTAVLRSDGDDPSAPAAAAFGDSETTEQVLAHVGLSVLTLRVARADGVERATGLALGGGVILASAHTMDGSTSVAVVVDGTKVPLEMVGSDPKTYLAVWRTANGADSGPAPEFGSSDEVRVGDPVAAVAAGRGDHWMGFGEVTAVNRLLVQDPVVVAGLMDSDTGAEPVHSGGPVVDTQGRVVAVLVVPPGTEPSGLAVPIEVARDVAGQLAVTGGAQHGWLGLVAADETDRTGGGAKIEKVVKHGPSAGSGIRRGDVVTGIRVGEAHIAIASVGELMAEVRSLRPGTSIDLDLLRDDQELRVTVWLGDAPAVPEAQS